MVVRSRFPSLYKLEKYKQCKIGDRFWRQGSFFGWAWGWVKNPVSDDERAEWESHIRVINAASWKGGSDSWVWLGASNGRFSIRSVKGLMEKEKENANIYALNWCKWVPLKCNIHAWRAEMDRIPTNEALGKRNIPMANSMCSFCGTSVETANHIFTNCLVSMAIWEGISRWFKMSPFSASSVRDLLNIAKTSGLEAEKKDMTHKTIIISCWSIWNARNGKIFKGKEEKLKEIIGEIKSLGFLWYKHILKRKTLEWFKWCNQSFI
ncbi:uncharacterized protein LOC143538559 [Bidens hawaiensis]|uniref:uncharacterized protein LOC143538559 n=1 Tax=Bidens hawaiensis TaxID=980011 RepID=UPI0040499C08